MLALCYCVKMYLIKIKHPAVRHYWPQLTVTKWRAMIADKTKGKKALRDFKAGCKGKRLSNCQIWAYSANSLTVQAPFGSKKSAADN